MKSVISSIEEKQSYISPCSTGFISGAGQATVHFSQGGKPSL